MWKIIGAEKLGERTILEVFLWSHNFYLCTRLANSFQVDQTSKRIRFESLSLKGNGQVLIERYSWISLLLNASFSGLLVYSFRRKALMCSSIKSPVNAFANEIDVVWELLDL